MVLSDTTENVKKTDNKGSLSEITQLDNCPFSIVENDNKFFGMCGKYRVTEEYTNKEELKVYLETVNWDKISQVLFVVIENLKEELKK